VKTAVVGIGVALAYALAFLAVIATPEARKRLNAAAVVALGVAVLAGVVLP
jgi:hypothetical protein